MTTALYESFDAEWSQTTLFRDLMIADSEQLAQFIRHHRPLHIAVTAIDPHLEGDSADFLRLLTRMVATASEPKRYPRLVFTSECNVSLWASAIEFLAVHCPTLLLERRVFCTWARPDDQGVDRMYRAIGAAQAVSLQDGVWREPRLI